MRNSCFLSGRCSKWKEDIWTTVFLDHSDREQIYIGDDNALTLEVSAENQGEGAYEAELLVYPPEQADFTGVIRKEVTEEAVKR